MTGRAFRLTSRSSSFLFPDPPGAPAALGHDHAHSAHQVRAAGMRPPAWVHKPAALALARRSRGRKGFFSASLAGRGSGRLQKRMGGPASPLFHAPPGELREAPLTPGLSPGHPLPPVLAPCVLYGAGAPTCWPPGVTEKRRGVTSSPSSPRPRPPAPSLTLSAFQPPPHTPPLHPSTPTLPTPSQSPPPWPPRPCPCRQAWPSAPARCPFLTARLSRPPSSPRTP